MIPNGPTDPSGAAPGEACDRMVRVSAYHDGELPPREAKALERHVKDCAACRQELHRLRALSTWLASGSLTAPSEAFLSHLRRSAPMRRSRTTLRIARWAAGIAAGVLVAFSALLWQREPARPSPVRPPAAWEQAAAAPAPGATALGAYEGIEMEVDVQIALAILGGGRGRNNNGHK